MSDQRVLVVDDEPFVRDLTIRALTREGLHCEAAEDGEHALAMFASTHFDAVVTDLRMPNKHGHALAVDLLSHEHRPVIVILTGVIEPRLAKDMLARGVDDIQYKPVDYGTLAAKVRALVERKNQYQVVEPETEVNVEPTTPEISPLDLKHNLSLVSHVLPISSVALEIMKLASSRICSAAQLAESIERDANLATEVRGMMNHQFYNPTREPIVQLEAAIARIGQKRLAELTLGTSLLTSLTSKTFEWLDTSTIWQTSVAAGIASECLHEQVTIETQDGSLFCCLVHELGRITLATMYSQTYDQIVGRSRDERCALVDVERDVFPENHVRVMSRLLENWNVLPDMYSPLRHLITPYPELAQLTEPLRSRVEVIKLAILIGHIATGRWHDEDLVELPSSRRLKELGIEDVQPIIARTREEFEQLLELHPNRSAIESLDSRATSRRIHYQDVSNEPIDLLVEMLPSFGVFPMKNQGDAHPLEKRLVNAIGAPMNRVPAKQLSDPNTIVLSNETLSTARATFLAVPCSVSEIRAAICTKVEPLEQMQPIGAQSTATFDRIG